MRLQAVIPSAASVAFLTIISAIPSAPVQPRPNFSDDIAPIIKNKCLPCHSPNGVGPFDFTSFRKFNHHIELIRIQTLSRNMPPTAGHSDFGRIATSPPLTDEEVVTIQGYIRAGMPEGKPLLNPISRPTESHPNITEARSSSSAPPSKSEGLMYWQSEVFLITQFTPLIGLQIVPDEPRVLRSAQFYIAAPGTDIDSIPANPNVFLSTPGVLPVGSWSPGFPAWKLPPQTSLNLAPGSSLIVLSKIQPSGRPQSTDFNLRFSQSEVPQPNQAEIVSFRKSNFSIPANSAPTLTIGKTMTHPAKLIALIPKARFYCGRIESEVVTKGQIKNLLTIDPWNPFWAGNYQFAIPVSLTAGTELRFNFTYYNDDRCEMNENRDPETVYSGSRWTDEACEMHMLISRPRQN